jgi:chaperonin GroES
MTLKPRLVDRLQGSYQAAEFDATKGNTSGVIPLGKKVLVQMDEFVGTFADGKLEFLPEMVERMNMASESGAVIECGPDAFAYHADGSRWVSRKPVPGEHVYAEKYAGLLIMGNDGKRYRLMDDSCIGAIYTVYAEGGEDGSRKE